MALFLKASSSFHKSLKLLHSTVSKVMMSPFNTSWGPQKCCFSVETRFQLLHLNSFTGLEEVKL